MKFANFSNPDRPKTAPEGSTRDPHLEGLGRLRANSGLLEVDPLSASWDSRDSEVRFAEATEASHFFSDENSPAGAVYEAVAEQSLQTLELVIELGGNVNEIMDATSGRTPLHLAAQLGLSDIAKTLVANDAFYAVDQQGNDPIHLAIQYGHTALTKQLVEWGKERNFGIDTPNSNKRTPLYLAIESKNLELVEFLLAHDAGVSVVIEGGSVALHLAVLQGEGAAITPIIDALVTKGFACLTTPDSEGRTALELAVSTGNLIATQALLPHYMQDPSAMPELHNLLAFLPPDREKTKAQWELKFAISDLYKKFEATSNATHRRSESRSNTQSIIWTTPPRAASTFTRTLSGNVVKPAPRKLVGTNHTAEASTQPNANPEEDPFTLNGKVIEGPSSTDPQTFADMQARWLAKRVQQAPQTWEALLGAMSAAPHNGVPTSASATQISTGKEK